MTSACDRDAQASCFLPETTLPTREATLAHPGLGRSARDLAAALFDRNLERAELLLRGDRALAGVRIGPHHDMLTVALATCQAGAVDLLLRYGAPRDGDGDGLPLRFALMAKDPAFAHALLRAGASPTPPENPLGAFRTAISAGSAGAVRMLLDFHGDPNVSDELGHRPLQIALDTERFRIAEILLDRGADAWAIDSGGGNLGSSVLAPMVTRDPEEAEAQRRLRARLPRLGWPSPPPSPEQIRTLALEGRWPPKGVRARPVPEKVLRVMRENAKR